MIFILEHTFVILAISFLNIQLCVCACAQAEYEINGECCPMCSPGSCVFRHCTEFISTTCIQCVGSSYTDEPNGLPKCLSCTVCDAGQGLRVKTACKQTSNTVCGPLEGFYCTDEHRGSCRYAVEHTKCSPGQYIKQQGTALKDAECAECAEGTFSNGSLQICEQHTKCEDLGLNKITPGTKSLDAQCGQKSQSALTAGIVVPIAVVITVLGAAFYKFQHKKHEPNADTGKEMRLSHNQPQENCISSEERIDLCVYHDPSQIASPVEDDFGGKC